MLENIRKERNEIMSLEYVTKDYWTKTWIEDLNKLLGAGMHSLETVFNKALYYLAARQKQSVFGRKIIDNPWTKYKLAYALMNSMIQSFVINEFSIAEFRKRFRQLGNVTIPKDVPRKTKFVEEGVFAELLGKIPLKPRLFLLVLILAGCRGMAVVNIKLADIAFKDDFAYFYIHEKGNKSFECSLPKFLVDEIVTNFKPKKYLLETDKKKQYARGNLNRYLKKHIEPVLGRRWHNHMARHSFATNNIRRGVSIKAIMDRLGHSSIHTTMKYLHDDYKETQLADYTAGIVANLTGVHVPEFKPEILPPKPKNLTKYELVAGQVKEASATIQEAQETVKTQRSLIDLIDRKRA